MFIKLKLVFIAFFLTTLSHAQQAQTLKVLSLHNKLDIARQSQSVEIAHDVVKKLSDKKFNIYDTSAKVLLPYQWLANGNLLVQIDLSSQETKKIEFYSSTRSKTFSPKVYGRFVPERYGDFAWENDKIAYRMYGEALEDIPAQNAWGMDIWAKTTKKSIIDKWYKRADYHRDHGDGLDFFQVGNTLGAGDILPFINNKLVYLGNYTSYKIINKGPLRFTFQLQYPSVQRNGYQITTVKKISLDQGELLNKFEVSYKFKGRKSKLPVLAGIAYGKKPGGKKILDSINGFAAYWPKPSKNGRIGTALIIPEPNHKFKDINKHLGVLKTLQNDQPFTFYAGGVWNKAEDITSAQAWKSYLTKKVRKLKHPIVVNVINK